MTLAALIGTVALSQAQYQHYYDLPVPRAMPQVTFYDYLTGSPWTPSALSRKLVLMFWWQPSCEPCKAHYPMLSKLHNRYKSREFMVLGPSLSSPVYEWVVRDLKIDFPVVTGEHSGVLRVSQTPSMMLIKRGQIVAQWKPDAMPKEAALQDAIEKHLSTRIRGGG